MSVRVEKKWGLFQSRFDMLSAGIMGAAFHARSVCFGKDMATELSPIFSGVYVKAAKKRGQPWRVRSKMQYLAFICAEGSPHFLLIIHCYF